MRSPQPLAVRIGIATGRGRRQAIKGRHARTRRRSGKRRIWPRGCRGWPAPIRSRHRARYAAPRGRAFALTDLGVHAQGDRPAGAGLARGRGARGPRAASRRLTAVRCSPPLVGREEEWGCWPPLAAGAQGRRTGRPAQRRARHRQVAAYAGTARARRQTRTPTLRYQCSPYPPQFTAVSIHRALGVFRGLRSRRYRRAEARKLEARARRQSARTRDPRRCLPPCSRYPPTVMRRSHLSPRKQKEKTLEALVAQSRRLSRRQPLCGGRGRHWVDPTSQELLALMVPQLRALPVLLVMTHRPEYMPLERIASRDYVDSEPACRRRAPSWLTLSPRARRCHRSGRRIFAHADGVPLYIEELTQSVLESGLLARGSNQLYAAGPLAALAIPTSLSASLKARSVAAPRSANGADRRVHRARILP